MAVLYKKLSQHESVILKNKSSVLGNKGGKML